MLDVDAAGTAYTTPLLGYGETVRALMGMMTSPSATLTWLSAVGTTKIRLGVNEVPAAMFASAQHLFSHALRLYTSMRPLSHGSLDERVSKRAKRNPASPYCWTDSIVKHHCDNVR